MKIANFLTSVAFVLAAFNANAQDLDDELVGQDNDNGFHFSTEFVTEDVWRGGFAGSAAFEPEISYTIGGLSIGTWGSSPLNFGQDNYNELDFYVEYAFDFGLSMIVNDYCWTQEYERIDGSIGEAFDYFGPYKENHYLEAGIAYDWGEVSDVPLSFNVNTMLAGANRKYNGDQGHSTYMELVFAPSLKKLDMSLTVGAAIENEEALMYSRKDGFNIVNVDFGLSHDFKIKDAATLTVRGHLVCNPTGFDTHGEAYVLGGVAIKF